MAVLSHEGTYPVLYGTWPIPVGASHRNGYIARPDEAGKVPVVFVIPGLGGMGSFEKDLCRRFAREGIAGISIDLYGKPGNGLDLYNETSDDSALFVLDELHQFLISDDVGWNVEDQVGLLGTDIGGRFAIVKAATRDWARSLAIAYTPLTGDEDREHQVADYLDHLPIPVLALFGAEDDLIDPATVDEAQRRNDHGQWLLYEDAAHGFLDIDAPGYHSGSADDAFARLLAFFKGTLTAAQIDELG